MQWHSALWFSVACFGSWNTFADLCGLSALIKMVWEILSMPFICSPGDTRQLFSSLHIFYQHLTFSHQKRFSQYIYIYQKQNSTYVCCSCCSLAGRFILTCLTSDCSDYCAFCSAVKRVVWRDGINFLLFEVSIETNKTHIWLNKKLWRID